MFTAACRSGLGGQIPVALWSNTDITLCNNIGQPSWPLLASIRKTHSPVCGLAYVWVCVWDGAVSDFSRPRWCCQYLNLFPFIEFLPDQNGLETGLSHGSVHICVIETVWKPLNQPFILIKSLYKLMQLFLTGFALFRTQILHLDINTVPKLSKSKIKKYLYNQTLQANIVIWSWTAWIHNFWHDK